MRVDQDTSALGVIQAGLAEVCRALMNVAAGARGKALIEDLRITFGGTPSEIVWQALYADCLRVVHSTIMADGVIEDREIEALYDIIAAASRQYAAGLQAQYGELAVVDRESARAFLDRYAADRGPFGRGARLRWLGLTLCRRAAELGEREALQRYTRTMTSMSTEARRLANIPAADPRRRSPTEELDELQRMLASEETAQGVDRRSQAFLGSCSVFSAVQQASSIYENDPFDVEAVHREARTSFEQLVAQATRRPHASDQGRMLVVLGDSGAGKTHVLRGFRRHVHDGNKGFVVYAQLQSRSQDYSRYLLFHLVESLTRRYSEPSGTTGLRELAGGLLRLAGPKLRQRLEVLADGRWDGRGNLAAHIDELVTDLLEIRELGSFDLDLLRVLLYALRPDPRTTSSVYKYLRCDSMNESDRAVIGNVTPRMGDDDPHWMILGLARFAAVTQRALVIMVDQVDLSGFDAESTTIFRRAIDALYRIVSECSSAVAVIACLSDLYSAARMQLNRPAIDRLENSPPIAKLKVNRSYTEIEAVVARRLSILFAEHGTVHRPDQAVYPIPEDELRQQENHRLRDVLEWCHQFQERCAAAGRIIAADETVIVEHKNRELDLDTIAAAWSEATQARDLEIPDDPEEVLDVVAEAARAYVDQMGLSLDVSPRKNDVLRLRMSRGEDHAALAIAVVNQNYHGGAFTGQIDSLRKRAKSMVPIAVRTLEFPRGRACDKAMGQLINMGGRGAYLDASTLRALVAFHRFQPPFAAERVAAWKLRDRPIASLPAVIEIFDFERSRVELRAGRRRRGSSPFDEVADAAEPPLETSPPESVRDAPRFELPTEKWLSEPVHEASPPALTRGAPTAPIPDALPLVPMRGVAPSGPHRGAASHQTRNAWPLAPSRGASETTTARDIPPQEPTRDSGPLRPLRGAAPLTTTSGALPVDGLAPGAERGAMRRDVSNDTRSAKAPRATALPRTVSDSNELGDAATASHLNGAQPHPPTERSEPWRGLGAEPPMPPVSPPRRVAGSEPPKPPEAATPQPPHGGTRAAAATGPALAKQIWVGNSTSFTAEPILLEPTALLRHVAIADAVGNGRLAAMLNLVEQALERCVPAIILDRTGEMSGYARADWWEHSADPARARRLADRIEVRLFTPGILSGRPLSVAVIPDMSLVAEGDRERAIRLAVTAVATALPAGSEAESERLALLQDAIGTLARRSSMYGLVELIALIESGSDVHGTTRADQRARQRLVDDLAALLGKADVFAPGAEPLTAATLIGPRPSGRVPLAIINTTLLGEGPRLPSWIAHLIGCLSREVAARTSKTLQTVLALDGAELLLPATPGNTSAAAPLEELLKCAGATGLGIILASAKPPDLDYQRCSAIDTWLVGKTDEPTQSKMKGLFKHRPLGHRNLIRLESARFVMLDGEGSREVERCAPLSRVERIGAAELRSLAARTRSQAASPTGHTDATSDDRNGREGVRPAADVLTAVPRP